MTSSPRRTTCFSEELVAAFLDKRLNHEARVRVMEHAAVCSDCGAVLGSSIAIRAEDQRAFDRRRPMLRTGSKTWLIAAVAAAVVALAAGWLLSPYGTNFRAHRELKALVEAANELPYRTVESRLSGAFVHRPLQRAMRGITEDSDRDVTMWRVMSASMRIGQTATKHPTVSTLHVLGVAHLIRGDVDAAILTLEDALQRCAGARDLVRALARCKDAKLLTDLSAGYYGRARQRNRTRDLYLSFDSADRAWQLVQTPETVWNRALSLQALHQRAAARDAWKTYRTLDPGSPWAAEALTHLERLDARSDADRWAQARTEIVAAAARNDQKRIEHLVCRFTQSARMWAEDEVFPAWARAHLSGAADEDELLKLARAAGAAIRTCSGAEMLASVSHDIERLARGERSRLNLIAHGLADYGTARRFYREHRIAEAQPFFESADEAFRKARCPFAAMTPVFLASCMYYRNEYDAVIRATTAALTATAQQATPPTAAAQHRWLRGLSFLYTGKPQRALEDFQSALVSFDQARESDNAASMHEMLAYCYDYLGASDEASHHRLQALEGFAGSDASVPRKSALLIATAKSALFHGAPLAALKLIDTQLEVMPPPERLDMRVNALLWRSRINELLGREDNAASDVRMALALCSRIPDRRMRESALNTIEFVQERVRSSPSSDSRMQVLEEAIDFATRTGDWYRLSTFYTAQADEYLRHNRDTDAEKALSTAIMHFESERTMLTDEELRSTFFEGKAGPYEMLTTLYARRGDHERAFDTVERSRARTLLDRIAYVQTSPPFRRVRDIQARLPADVAVVVTSATADEILTWIVTRRTFTMRRLNTSRASVARLVSSYDEALSGDDASRVTLLAEQLYDLLVRPWIAAIQRDASLVIVSDPQLTGVPYAALVDGKSGQYLIEKHAIQLAPSVNVFLECVLNDARLRSSASGTALFVAPAAEGYTGRAPALAFTRREADALAALYGARATVLRGRSATKRAFIQGAVKAGIVHVAGHTEPGIRGVDARILLAAGQGQTEEAITGAEIRQLTFDRTRIVVLSSCTSARDGYGQQGVSSLARAFIAAGVPTVVGSLWPVDDASANELLVEFHRHLHSGLEAAHALRLAQMTMIRDRRRSPEAVRSWAAFTVVGSSIRKGEEHG